ncbi:hypothetical protein LOAG_06116 [Loa loa]|uniref:Secreted protein n=1 Tax=Loa loa TaxID=7209 RepID=A0A1S0TYG7_LOALO|nr:hypothetical protein LOAG_06116 [Loa loa]EFO22372.1 hypothetical protein LOAG_06116 [Loa loa]
MMMMMKMMMMMMIVMSDDDDDDDDDEDDSISYSWPLSHSRRVIRQRPRLQYFPTMPLARNVSLIDRVIVPSFNLRANSMNSLRNIRSRHSRGFFYPSFPERRWSFSHLP